MRVWVYCMKIFRCTYSTLRMESRIYTTQLYLLDAIIPQHNSRIKLNFHFISYEGYHKYRKSMNFQHHISSCLILLIVLIPSTLCSINICIVFVCIALFHMWCRNYVHWLLMLTNRLFEIHLNSTHIDYKQFTDCIA